MLKYKVLLRDYEKKKKIFRNVEIVENIYKDVDKFVKRLIKRMLQRYSARVVYKEVVELTKRMNTHISIH